MRLFPSAQRYIGRMHEIVADTIDRPILCCCGELLRDPNPEPRQKQGQDEQPSTFWERAKKVRNNLVSRVGMTSVAICSKEACHCELKKEKLASFIKLTVLLSIYIYPQTEESNLILVKTKSNSFFHRWV